MGLIVSSLDKMSHMSHPCEEDRSLFSKCEGTKTTSKTFVCLLWIYTTV